MDGPIREKKMDINSREGKISEQPMNMKEKRGEEDSGVFFDFCGNKLNNC